jgi:hypothetical protein
MNDFILNTSEDGLGQIKLRAQKQSVWPTQLEMAVVAWFTQPATTEKSSVAQ